MCLCVCVCLPQQTCWSSHSSLSQRPLELQGHTSYQHKHINAWAHTLPGSVLCANMWTQTPTVSINSARCTRCAKSVFVIPIKNLCYSWHHLCYSMSDFVYLLHHGFLRCHQTGNLTSAFLSVSSSVSICLTFTPSVRLSVFLSVFPSFFLHGLHQHWWSMEHATSGGSRRHAHQRQIICGRQQSLTWHWLRMRLFI